MRDGFLRHVDREGRRELGDAAEHRDAAARHRLARLHHGDLLGFGERAVLAHGAADDEPRHAVADQALHDARGGVDVEREIGLELRGDGGEDAFPANVLAHGGLLRTGTGQRS